jgi:hypothetical protein
MLTVTTGQALFSARMSRIDVFAVDGASRRIEMLKGRMLWFRPNPEGFGRRVHSAARSPVLA